MEESGKLRVGPGPILCSLRGESLDMGFLTQWMLSAIIWCLDKASICLVFISLVRRLLVVLIWLSATFSTKSFRCFCFPQALGQVLFSFSFRATLSVTTRICEASSAVSCLRSAAARASGQGRMRGTQWYMGAAHACYNNYQSEYGGMC